MNQNDNELIPVKVYLFPSYVSIRNVPREIHELFASHGIELVEEHWGGTTETIPTSEPVLVRTSSQQQCADRDVIRHCEAHGHLAFYDNRILLPQGAYAGLKDERALPLIDAFVQRVRASQLPPEQTIAYLRSKPMDSSTLGEGLHLQRTTRLLLRLFGQYVVSDEIAFDATRFATDYHVVGIGGDTPLETRKQSLIPGMDTEGITALRQQCEADRKELEAEGLTPTSDGPVAQAYRRKLYRGLRKTLQSVQTANETTGAMYEAGGNPLVSGLMGFCDGLDTLMGTFMARHNSWATTTAMQELYDLALPILIEKLVAAGYPDHSEGIEWDYGEGGKARGMGMLGQLSAATGGAVSVSAQLSTDVKATCTDCGHVGNHTIVQPLEPDGRTPKGNAYLTPPTCARCGSLMPEPQVSSSKKD